MLSSCNEHLPQNIQWHEVLSHFPKSTPMFNACSMHTGYCHACKNCITCISKTLYLTHKLIVINQCYFKYLTIKMNHHHNIWVLLIHSIKKLLLARKRNYPSKLRSEKSSIQTTSYLNRKLNRSNKTFKCD